MFSHRVLVRILYITVLLLCCAFVAGLTLLLQSKQYVYSVAEPHSTEDFVEPFPVSVDVVTKTISDVPFYEEYTSEHITKLEDTSKPGFFDKLVALLFSHDWYQNLASPVSRIIVIWPGERKEEVVSNIGDVLGWDAEEREDFELLITTANPIISDGTFYPGKYVAHKNAPPEEVAAVIQSEFQTEVLDRYTPEVEAKVTLDDALIIASLLEREASDFENMREVSGVIWNRLFADMPLQLDATLQYARGSRATEKAWWPTPLPADKFIDSPYNTYQNKGLPPAPIANPTAEAVIAALNPEPTDCLFYFHDSKQDYHCSVTYEEHVSKLKAAYGRGQ